MTTLLKVEGMSCSHCENRVVKYVTGMDGVSSAVASAKDGTVTVELCRWMPLRPSSTIWAMR